jgi:DNA invertase Pin-like site-specific DNA recombinase
MSDETACVDVVAYLRVSTDRQADRGLGLQVQRQAIELWSNRSGIRVAGIFSDEGVSGAVSPSERPGLSAALREIRQGRVEGLAIARLDRLARTLSIQEACLAQIWQWHGRVFTCDLGEVMPDDQSDPMRTALRQMVAVFGQLERATITARMRDGRRKKAELGGYAYGAPPYGMRAEAGNLVEADEKQKHSDELWPWMLKANR